VSSLTFGTLKAINPKVNSEVASGAMIAVGEPSVWPFPMDFSFQTLDSGRMRNKKHFGKYRGIVINNIDPMRMGRLMVQVPEMRASPSPMAKGRWLPWLARSLAPT
jgi:hypothetical protein